MILFFFIMHIRYIRYIPIIMFWLPAANNSPAISTQLVGVVVEGGGSTKRTIENPSVEEDKRNPYAGNDERHFESDRTRSGIIERKSVFIAQG